VQVEAGHLQRVYIAIPYPLKSSVRPQEGWAGARSAWSAELSEKGSWHSPYFAIFGRWNIGAQIYECPELNSQRSRAFHRGDHHAAQRTSATPRLHRQVFQVFVRFKFFY
jgi:hypothetical protein